MIYGENLKKSPVIVNHKQLIRIGDSPYRSKCPFCENGILFVYRNEKTFELEQKDCCIVCGQRVEYADIEAMRLREKK